MSRQFSFPAIERQSMSRRAFVRTCAAAAGASALATSLPAISGDDKAQIAITLDLEMSRHYPRRGMMEWDYEKGNLDQATKEYSLKAAKVAEEYDGLIHFFCVGRVLEQENVDWLIELSEAGHPIGNHTYDHVNLLADSPVNTQFRFQRSPWLVEGKTTEQVIRENIRLTEIAMDQRLSIQSSGFRTPGGFRNGLTGRADLQELLAELGFRWVSSKYPQHQIGNEGERPTQQILEDIVRAQQEAQPFRYESGLIEIPMSPISDVTAFRSQRWQLDDFLTAIEMAVEWSIDNSACFDFLGHPSCLVVEDPECETIRLICERVSAASARAEVVDLDTIAASRFE